MPEQAIPVASDARTVLFVCPHGAGKSRMAAAYFAGAAPPGWRGTTAGLHPAEAVSQVAVRLLSGTAEDAALDREPPRPLDVVARPALVVSIDCDAAPEMPVGAGARHVRWDLSSRVMDEAMRDELRGLARALAADLAREPNADARGSA